MPPKKKSMSAVSGSSIQTNKRTTESLLPGLAKRRKYADDADPNEERIMDSYCWICHQSGKDIDCNDCQRVYHTHCLNKASLEFSDETCPECQLKSLNNVNQSTFLTVQILREILSVAATQFRKKFKSPDKNIFFQWPNIEDSELVRIIDFDLLEDNIKDENNPYQSLSEIMSDIKWIHHNYSILDGVDSPTAKEAEGFVRMFQKEIADIEDCPNCYYSMFVERRTEDFFMNICDPPHDIIWAWLKGSSPWPAKCLRVENGKAHVRFFGTHDKSNIPIGNKKCLAISLTHPTHKKSKLTDANLIPKKKDYKIAVDELLIYIDRYERKFCKKFVYYEPGTPYKGEVIKPSRKKRSRNRRNVSSVSNPEESVTLPPVSESVTLPPVSESVTLPPVSESVTLPPASESVTLPPASEIVLDDSNVIGIQSCVSSEIEVGTSQEEDNLIVQVSTEGEVNIDRLVNYLATESADPTSDTGVFSEENFSVPSSPVVTASMVCEVASSDDAQSVYTNLDLDGGTSLSHSNFQPLPSCSSTPLAIPSTSNQLNALSDRPHNLLPSNDLQEELMRNMYSESPQMHSDSEVLPTENIPFSIPSSSVSESMNGEDDDVIFLSSNRRPRNSNLNPSSILPYILSGNPDLQSLFRDGRYVFDSLFIRCWAFANRLPQAPELITNMMAEIKKLSLEKNKIQREKEEIERNNCVNENRILREKVVKLTEENDSLKMSYDVTKAQLSALEAINQKAIGNAFNICQGLYKAYITKFQGADLNLLEAKELQLSEKNEEVQRMTRELKEANQKLQESNRELQSKEEMIQELTESLELLKTEIIELKARNHEVGEAYTVKLEELLKLQREKMSWETKEEVKGMVNKHLSDLGVVQIQKPNSSGAAFQEQNLSINICDNASGSSKKSSRSSVTKSQEAYHRRMSHEALATDQQICQQRIRQEAHIKTIAKKTSVNIQLEHSKTITTRNEGTMYHRPPALYGPPFPTPASLYARPPEAIPVNTPYDLSQHIAHRERYHAHSPTNFLQNAHGRDKPFKDARKRQSRYSHHDKI